MRGGGSQSSAPPAAVRAPRAATRLPRRRASLRIFVVGGGLPCDPPVGGHSCNGGMIPRFHRVTSSLLARLIEVTQIGRRVVFLRGHETFHSAHHVVP